MIPPPTPISPLTTPPASPIPISTGPGVDRFALAAAAPSIRGVYGPPRPRSLADSRWAGFLLSVHDKCTLDLMSPQPETWMSPPNPPRYAAFPSPTSALPPLPVTPAPHAVISVNAGIQSSSQTASAPVRQAGGAPAPNAIRDRHPVLPRAAAPPAGMRPAASEEFFRKNSYTREAAPCRASPRPSHGSALAPRQPRCRHVAWETSRLLA
jgi:hypothetical protein